MKSRILICSICACLILLVVLLLVYCCLREHLGITSIDKQWEFTQDFVSILSSLAAVIGLPWAIWLYFTQREKERIDKWHERARRLLEELIFILGDEKLIKNQITINSLLYRLRSYIGNFNKPVNNDYLSSLQTHLNQLFHHLERDSLLGNNSSNNNLLIRQTVSYCSTDLLELDEGHRKTVFDLAAAAVFSNTFKISEIAGIPNIAIKNGFDPQLLSRLLLLAQPIATNFTHKAADVLWRQDQLQELFNIVPELIATYIYLFYSESGCQLLLRLDKEMNKKQD